MRSLRTALFIVAALLSLGSCSRQPILLLANNTGATIEVLRVLATGIDGDPMHRSLLEVMRGQALRIGNGRVREIAPASWVMENRTWTIDVRAGHCQLSFQISFDVGGHYQYDRVWWPQQGIDASHRGDPTLQLEPDGTLHLIPGGSTSALDVTPFTAIQPDGFPMSPAAERCGSADNH